MTQLVDFLVIGGGIIGINVARRLKHLYPDSSVIILEKEADVGLHASGRNSGVLHAGFYYTPDSMKAQLTKDGNKEMQDYCLSNGIPINKCGKLVVTKNEDELQSLDVLLERGKANGIELENITESEAREIEPRARTFSRAIFSPTTASVDPSIVMDSMKNNALNEGVKIQYGAQFLKRSDKKLITSCGNYQAGYVVNSAGLYADKVAKQFEFSSRYRILPFKGLYLYSSESAGSLRTNIYPVPDLNNPFLGVHFTLTANGAIKIGPTAIPAFWRENYEGLTNFKFGELLDICIRQSGLFFTSGFDFRRLAWDELRKYFRGRMVSLAKSLASEVNLRDYKNRGRPGIRAQLLDIKEKKLEMDFVLEGDENSMHILNAVSPAFTCSLPFARAVCYRIQGNLN